MSVGTQDIVIGWFAQEVHEPNLWSVRVFGRINGKRYQGALDWSRGDLGDPVHDLMTREQAVESALVVAKRVMTYRDAEITSVYVMPTFTEDGRWCWSMQPLTPGSIAHSAWQQSLERA